mmetsp:Transcript_19683/g.55613  ORF Transcript_19683/g.55613 Transcript_19683/m.55613 type:complete len:471 (-) Transcript_19683:196-1608(-)
MKRPAATISDNEVTTNTQDAYVSESDNSTCGQQPQCFAKCSVWNRNFIAVPQPRKKPSPTEGERAVVEGLNALSIKEREDVYEEIHGIHNANTIEETPEMISRAVDDLQKYISKMNRHQKQAYELTRLMSPRFVQDRAFLLMFLRADLFDVAKAANRLVNNLELKLELFGVDRMAKHITWEDMDEDDRAAVLNCSSQYYPELKDNAGRTVWVAAMGKDEYKTDNNHFRCSYYTVMGMMMGNDNAQTRGIVGIAHMVGLSEKKFNNTVAFRSMKLIEAMPFRYAALHICYDNPNLRGPIGMLQLIANVQNRVRFRAHFGTFVECQYQLMTFGLNQDIFPFDSTGNIKTEKFMAMLRDRIQKEAEIEEERRNDSSRIEYPRSVDVLFGRGKAYNDFNGNILMYAHIDRYKGRYQQATSRDEKTLIAETVLLTIKESGGRFLKRSKDPMDGWVTVTDTVAREKISHCFRTRLK